MTELLWHDFFKIGIDFIDDDHKGLLKIMQEIKSTIKECDYKKRTSLLALLLKEAEEHFSREENFLSEVNFPGQEKHKMYHKELLIKADATKRLCEGVESEDDMVKCFDGMFEFLIDDILRGDIKFKSYLEYEGYIKKTS
ncbi:MAG: hemerythrin domain-containing protein [Gammaproteobacteria bacterium]|nr:hemerythrin domain-containing protein [Gammaproteobacteria bacterium]